jgi:DNA-binding protein H-NS
MQTALAHELILEAIQMKIAKQRSKPVDELFWELHELVVAERDVLESLIRQLSLTGSDGSLKRDRRSYPKLFYRNPNNQQETWSGRGRRPDWLTAQLRVGKQLSDFLISETSQSNGLKPPTADTSAV